MLGASSSPHAQVHDADGRILCLAKCNVEAKGFALLLAFFFVKCHRCSHLLHPNSTSPYLFLSIMSADTATAALALASRTAHAYTRTCALPALHSRIERADMQRATGAPATWAQPLVQVCPILIRSLELLRPRLQALQQQLSVLQAAVQRPPASAFAMKSEAAFCSESDVLRQRVAHLAAEDASIAAATACAHTWTVMQHEQLKAINEELPLAGKQTILSPRV